MDISKKLKSSIAHQIACIERPYINSFAGTGRSRRRHSGDIHAIARKIIDRTFDPFAFHWDFGNGEPATGNDVYLTVFTALFDIDDEDARRWSDKAEGDAARNEAAHDIARALQRKFTISERRMILTKTHQGSGSFGDPGGAHSLSDSKYEDERDW